MAETSLTTDRAIFNVIEQCWQNKRRPKTKRALCSKPRRSGYPKPTRPRPKKCELCGRNPKPRVLHLDHCHETDKFRGWLCSQCNTGIGLLGDSASKLDAALAYLRRAE